MLGYTRSLTSKEMFDAVNWMMDHEALCSYHGVGKYSYDHDMTEVHEGLSRYRGLKVTIRCKCGKFKELGAK